MCTCGFRINANLVKEGSFCINAKLVKEELNQTYIRFAYAQGSVCWPQPLQLSCRAAEQDVCPLWSLDEDWSKARRMVCVG